MNTETRRHPAPARLAWQLTGLLGLGAWYLARTEGPPGGGLHVLGWALVAILLFRHVRRGQWPVTGAARIPWGRDTAAGLAIVGVLAAEAALLNTPLAFLAGHALTLTAVHAAWHLEQRRRLLHIAATGFFLFTAASLLDQSLLFAPLFAAFAVLFSAFLITLQSSELPVGELDRQDVRRGWNTSSLVLVTVLAFLIVPRSSQPLLPSTSVGGRAVTGVEANLRLDRYGRLFQRNDVFYRVFSPPGYLRSRTYDVWDGRGWESTRGEVAVVQARGSRTRARLLWPPRTISPDRADRLSWSLQVIRARAAPARTIPIPLGAIAVDAPTPRLSIYSDRRVIVDKPTPPGQTVRFATEMRRGGRTAEGSFVWLPPDRQPSRDIDETLLLDLTNVPPKVVELAQKVAGGAETPLDKVCAITAFLQAGYSYTVDLGPGPRLGTDPVSWFLFDRRAAHCAYFSTAAALMLRSVGVPTRLVAGFAIREMNDVGGYYVVRARHAHAWVEALVEHHRWLTVDPSPPISATAEDSAWAAPSRWRKQLDWLSYQWQRALVGYDGKRQRAIAATLLRLVREVLEIAKGLPLVGLGLLACALVYLRARRRPGAVTPRGSGGTTVRQQVLDHLRRWARVLLRLVSRPTRGAVDEPPSRRAYREAVEMLTTALNMPRPAWAGPETYADLVRRRAPEAIAQSMETIAHLYGRDRFGPTPLTAEENDRIAAALAALRRHVLE